MVVSVRPWDCRGLIAPCREKGLSRKSIESIGRTLSRVLSQAVADGTLQANPAFGLGRYHRTVNELKLEIRLLTREEVALFLETARKRTPRRPIVSLCTASRLASGELLGLSGAMSIFTGGHRRSPPPRRRSCHEAQER